MKNLLLPLCVALCLGLLTACSQSIVESEAVFEPVSLEDMEHHSPNVTYVNEGNISVQAAKDYYEDSSVRVERTHTFSNGETFHYATSGEEVMTGDIVLGTVKQLKRDIKAYEKQLKSGKKSGDAN